ncbi:hypothetical protein KAW18_16485 [candidate division WOR-3 bacterium]|nr:hypothetical protein [candidate division WOR-3 bacterium]
MKLRCVIGSLRFSDGMEYSKGDIFSLNDEILLQTLLRGGNVEEIVQKKVEPKHIKVKRRVKPKR